MVDKLRRKRDQRGLFAILQSCPAEASLAIVLLT